jgi:hypothetical protein
MKQTIVNIPYGDQNLQLAIPEQNLLGIIEPKPAAVDGSSSSENKPDEDQIIWQALPGCRTSFGPANASP